MIKGLLGKSLIHSYSKEINEEIDNKNNYEYFNILEEDIKDFLNSKIEYLNVTIPYKEKILPFLDSIDNIANEIGACNLIVKENDKLVGYNTDYYGFQEMLVNNNIEVTNKKILILGTGGSSRMVSFYFSNNYVQSITYVSRTLNNHNTITYDKLKDEGYQIIVNCSPCGMYPNINECLIDVNMFSSLEVVIDLVYNPFRTKLIIDSINKKIKTINGLSMLIYQAIYGNIIAGCLDQSINKTELYNRILAKILAKRNVVLIGMPGSGKTAIAKVLKEELSDYDIIDTDEEIEKDNGLIGNIFEYHGEKYFRELEKKVIRNVCLKQHTIISTGGGVILDSENMDLLKANGIIIFINRNIESISLNSSRPLMHTRVQKINLFNKRIFLYEQYADLIVNNKSISKTIKEIKEIINR